MSTIPNPLDALRRVTPRAGPPNIPNVNGLGPQTNTAAAQRPPAAPAVAPRPGPAPLTPPPAGPAVAGAGGWGERAAKPWTLSMRAFSPSNHASVFRSL